MSKDLMKILTDNGLLEYGAVIDQELIYDALDIVMPETATREVFSELALREVSAISYVRNILIDRGMHLASNGQGRGYRIASPSENEERALLWEASGTRKMNRARRLRTYTPKQVDEMPSQINARLVMKLSSRRRN